MHPARKPSPQLLRMHDELWRLVQWNFSANAFLLSGVQRGAFANCLRLFQNQWGTPAR